MAPILTLWLGSMAWILGANFILEASKLDLAFSIYGKSVCSEQLSVLCEVSTFNSTSSF